MKKLILILVIQMLVISNTAAAELIAQIPWDTDETEYLVKVYDSRDENNIPMRRLEFINKVTNEVISKFSTTDNFVSGFALRDVGGCLVTQWIGRKNYHFQVFKAYKADVHKVLEIVSENGFRIYAAEDVCPMIMVQENNSWNTYKWIIDKYQKVSQ